MSTARGGRNVPKKRKPTDPDATRMQFTLAFPIEYGKRIQACAETILGPDKAPQFLVMLIRQLLPKFEKRAEKILNGEDPDA